MKQTAKNIAIIGVLVSLALALSVAESIFPIGLVIPIPGIKLGLANIVTLFALFYLGPVPAFVILLLRCFLAALFTGISSLAFSLAGGMLAFGMMLLLKTRYGRGFSLFGISMGGAVFHNIGQIAVAALVLGNAILFSYLPFLLLTGLVTGFAVAAVSLPVMRAIDRHETLRNIFPYALRHPRP